MTTYAEALELEALAKELVSVMRARREKLARAAVLLAEHHPDLIEDALRVALERAEKARKAPG